MFWFSVEKLSLKIFQLKLTFYKYKQSIEDYHKTLIPVSLTES